MRKLEKLRADVSTYTVNAEAGEIKGVRIMSAKVADAAGLLLASDPIASRFIARTNLDASPVRVV
jgi:hypothetical protein